MNIEYCYTGNNLNGLVERLKEFLSYDEKTGFFIWIKKPNNRSPNIHIGRPLAKANKSGYLTITFEGKTYKSHRLAWFYVYGYMPTEIDHINGIKSDNRIENLRICTRSENGRNRGKQSNNNSGFKGVGYLKSSKKWRARVILNKKEYHLGLFETKELANQAYANHAKKLHGEFYRD